MDILISKIAEVILNPLIYLMVTAAVLYFIFGVITFITKSDDDTGRKDGQRHMIYGIIGLTIILGAWGIIALIDSFIQDIDTSNSESILETYERA